MIFGWIKYNEGGPVPYPINLGSFLTIESSTIDPKTLLDDIRDEKKLIIHQTESGWPENPPFIMFIGWSQEDYLEVAKAFHMAIWKDDPKDWHLFKAIFHTSCENPSGQFGSAELYYYKEIKVDSDKKYSVRIIEIQPQYGYIAWGGDTIYPRPFRGWDRIEIEDIMNFPAEKALALASQQGGDDFLKNNSVCNIHVGLWPWGYSRSDWRVSYSGKTNVLFWIPSK